MVAAPQNKYGLGIGRPPNHEWPDEKLVEMGEELLTWIKECDEKEVVVVHLSQWWSYKKQIGHEEWKAIKKRISFRPYYEIASKWMATKIILNKDYAQSYGNRYLGMYDKELKEEEREEKQFDHDLKMAEEAAKNPATLAAEAKQQADSLNP